MVYYYLVAPCQRVNPMPILPYNRKFRDRARSLRKSGNLSEVLMWNQLKAGKIKGFQFLRQKSIDNYILDFYCRRLKLAIEIDGASHDAKVEEDKFRQEQIESYGITFLRFADNEVKNNLNAVIKAVSEKINDLSPAV